MTYRPRLRGSPLLSLFGGPLDTGNHGVSALGISTLVNLARRAPRARMVVFDNRVTRRPLRLRFDDVVVEAHRRGARLSHRIHRGDTLGSMYLASRIAPQSNRNVRTMAASDLILDITGGDSFSDLYGARRFHLVTRPKQIALQLQRPLMLLPQTYGPFRTADARELARDVVRGATLAYARDADSFEVLQDLLGPHLDPARHRLGVDVAFSLPRRTPTLPLPLLERWRTEGREVVGINVSGLLYNDVPAARDRFGLSIDYADVLSSFSRLILERSDAAVLLVPHVRRGAESDDLASARLADRLGHEDRVMVLPQLGACETKDVISTLDWFTGARMHATIAALSTCTPVAAVAYSAKFAGVFAGCGVPDRALDGRRLSTGELLDGLLASWEERHADRQRLRAAVPSVVAAAGEQFDHILRAT